MTFLRDVAPVLLLATGSTGFQTNRVPWTTLTVLKMGYLDNLSGPTQTAPLASGGGGGGGSYLDALTSNAPVAGICGSGPPGYLHTLAANAAPDLDSGESGSTSYLDSMASPGTAAPAPQSVEEKQIVIEQPSSGVSPASYLDALVSDDSPSTGGGSGLSGYLDSMASNAYPLGGGSGPTGYLDMMTSSAAPALDGDGSGPASYLDSMAPPAATAAPVAPAASSTSSGASPASYLDALASNASPSSDGGSGPAGYLDNLAANASPLGGGSGPASYLDGVDSQIVQTIDPPAAAADPITPEVEVVVQAPSANAISAKSDTSSDTLAKLVSATEKINALSTKAYVETQIDMLRAQTDLLELEYLSNKGKLEDSDVHRVENLHAKVLADASGSSIVQDMYIKLRDRVISRLMI